MNCSSTLNKGNKKAKESGDVWGSKIPQGGEIRASFHGEFWFRIPSGNQTILLKLQSECCGFPEAVARASLLSLAWTLLLQQQTFPGKLLLFVHLTVYSRAR